MPPLFVVVKCTIHLFLFHQICIKTDNNILNNQLKSSPLSVNTIIIVIFREYQSEMGKFQVFKYNQFVMSLIGISSDRSNDLYQFMKNVYFFCCLFGICVISVGVFLFNHRTDFRLVVPASLPLLAGLQASGCYLNIRLKTKEIQMLNLSLQRIVNEG